MSVQAADKIFTVEIQAAPYPAPWVAEQGQGKLAPVSFDFVVNKPGIMPIAVDLLAGGQFSAGNVAHLVTRFIAHSFMAVTLFPPRRHGNQKRGHAHRGRVRRCCRPTRGRTFRRHSRRP